MSGLNKIIPIKKKLCLKLIIWAVKQAKETRHMAPNFFLISCTHHIIFQPQVPFGVRLGFSLITAVAAVSH
jgi:hypothetical protein